ncbi:hypothetical protein PA598K_06120 [Paenibacillus sp. 598K]|nr:hypothetical protein PA598K_06120 [Paenibacillus sp. 598K]
MYYNPFFQKIKTALKLPRIPSRHSYALYFALCIRDNREKQSAAEIGRIIKGVE